MSFIKTLCLLAGCWLGQGLCDGFSSGYYLPPPFGRLSPATPNTAFPFFYQFPQSPVIIQDSQFVYDFINPVDPNIISYSNLGSVTEEVHPLSGSLNDLEKIRAENGRYGTFIADDYLIDPCDLYTYRPSLCEAMYSEFTSGREMPFGYALISPLGGYNYTLGSYGLISSGIDEGIVPFPQFPVDPEYSTITPSLNESDVEILGSIGSSETTNEETDVNSFRQSTLDAQNANGIDSNETSSNVPSRNNATDGDILFGYIDQAGFPRIVTCSVKQLWTGERVIEIPRWEFVDFGQYNPPPLIRTFRSVPQPASSKKVILAPHNLANKS